MYGKKKITPNKKQHFRTIPLKKLLKSKNKNGQVYTKKGLLRRTALV